MGWLQKTGCSRTTYFLSLPHHLLVLGRTVANNFKLQKTKNNYMCFFLRQKELKKIITYGTTTTYTGGRAEGSRYNVYKYKYHVTPSRSMMVSISKKCSNTLWNSQNQSIIQPLFQLHTTQTFTSKQLLLSFTLRVPYCSFKHQS